MNGRPLLRILVILFGFFLVGWPVWSVTHTSFVDAPVKENAKKNPEEPLRVEVTFSTPPSSFDLDYLGKPLLTGKAPDREFSADWKVAIPKEGVELFMAAGWLPGSPLSAVRVRVTQGGNVIAEQTFWATENLAETLTVNKPQP